MGTISFRNADRMMTSAEPLNRGVEIAFADGCKGLIPFDAIPELREQTGRVTVELPSPYEMVLTTAVGVRVEIPWDFARHYCDPSYRQRVEDVASAGRSALGARIKALRQTAGITQAQLAHGAGMGRVTLARIESGTQSPRFQTLIAIAEALRVPVQDLVTTDE